MKLAIICDDEFEARRIPAQEVDVLVSLGDLPDSVILEVANQCCPKEILAVKGNHDSAAPFPKPIRDLHLKTFTLDGVTFGGFCGAWKYKPKGNYLFEQDEVEKFMADFPAVQIFISHNSPRGVHDRDDEVHVGFVGLSNYIARVKPKIFIHGHQHQNIESLVGTTRVIGVYGFRFLDF